MSAVPSLHYVVVIIQEIFVFLKIFNTNVFWMSLLWTHRTVSIYWSVRSFVGGSTLFIARACVVMQFWVPYCCPAMYTLRLFTFDTPLPHVERIAFLQLFTVSSLGVLRIFFWYHFIMLPSFHGYVNITCDTVLYPLLFQFLVFHWKCHIIDIDNESNLWNVVLVGNEFGCSQMSENSYDQTL